MGVFRAWAEDGTRRQPAFSSHFVQERKAIIRMVFIAFALVSLIGIALQSWYFGAYFRQTENAYRLTVRVLDLDSRYADTITGAPDAILGPAVRTAVSRAVSSSPKFHLGFQVADDYELSQLKLTEGGQGVNTTDYARQLVTSQTVWGVIIIHANATVLATEAAQTGSTGYDPRGAIAFFYEEARNFYGTNQYLVTYSDIVIRSGTQEANIQFAQNLLNQAVNAGSITTLTTASNGKALASPFGFSTFNLRPFDQIVAEAPTTAGAIYLIIFTFLISPIWKEAFTPFSNKLTKSSELILKIAVPIFAYFWLSLMYSLVSLAFLVDFTRKYGHVGFFLYWLMNWTTMTSLGLIMESALAVLGPLGMPFFLIGWVIINVSVAFVSISDQDHFYAYGFIMPVWNSVDAGKSIIFGTKNHLAQNFLVCLGWIIAGAIILMSITAYQRSKSDKEEMKQQSEKK